MAFSPRMRTMMGFVSIGVYALIGTLAWPKVVWLTAACGALIVVRLFLLIRQWPQRKAQP